jgi:hypothetical protein
VSAGAASADGSVLYVVFHRDGTLSAVLADGTPVGTTSGAGTPIPPGAYTVQIDNSNNADIEFDLSGPGVKLVNDLSNGEELAAAFPVTFQPGSSYSFRDDNRPSTVWTFSTSTAAGSSGAGTTTSSTGAAGTTPAGPKGSQTSKDLVGSAILAFRGALTGTVSATGAVAIRYRGAPISTLHEGRYRITVHDASARRGLTIERLGGAAEVVTRTRYVGTHTAVVSLRRGQWVYDAGSGARRHFFVTP